MLGVLVVRVQGVLEIIHIIFKLLEFWQHGSGVFAPEYDAVNDIGRQVDFAYLMKAHGISDISIIFFDSFQKPVGEKGRNVGSSACADNHGVFLLFYRVKGILQVVENIINMLRTDGKADGIGPDTLCF